MRNRTHEVKIRLNDEEFAHLNEMVSRSIYNRETFLRFFLNGYTMQECPKEYNEFRVTLIRLASDLKLFRFSSALTPEEERRLMQIGDEVWALIKKLNLIYAPYYKEKKEKYDYEWYIAPIVGKCSAITRIRIIRASTISAAPTM